MEERKILVARTAGFCFGVKRAVEKVYEQVNMGKQNIYTYGPIIHNEEVVTDLEKKGVRVLENEQELKNLMEGTVVIRSHGVPKEIYEVIEEKGLECVDHSPLKKDAEGIWRMDYEDMDAKIKEHHIHVAVFCNPHNPCGRVWERWEIEKAMEVYKANDCVVISDEIWSDLILEGYHHTPAQSVSEDARNRTVAMYAPSKTLSPITLRPFSLSVGMPCMVALIMEANF